MVTNSELRLRARTALKGNWQVALLVMFIASLPSLISQVVTVLQGNTLTDVIYNQLQSGAYEMLNDPQYLLNLAEYQASSAYLLRNVMSVVTFLVSPFLTLGMLNYTLRLLRGESDFITTVFSRRGCFFKAIGLQLMVTLKIILWALPGLALTVIAALVGVAGIGANSSGLSWLFMILLYASYAVLISLVVMAMFRYAMATTVQADHPEYGVMQCIAVSKAMMRERKFMLFTLEFSFVGWYLLLALAQYGLSALFGSIVGSTVYMLLNLVLQVYQQTAVCAFFENYRPQAA